MEIPDDCTSASSSRFRPPRIIGGKRPAEIVLLLALTAVLQGQTAPDAVEVLAQARARISITMRRLPKYACIQTIDRSYFRRISSSRAAGAVAPPCDQLSADKKKGNKRASLVSTDRLRLDVAQGEGREMTSWPGASRFDMQDIDQVIDRGPIGTGSFGGYLVDIFDNEGARFDYLGEKTSGSGHVFVYGFQVAQEASHYEIRADDSWLITGYDGTFEVDPDSFELKRITIQTPELPPETHLCEAASTLDYQRVRIGDGDFLLPRQSQLHLMLRDTQETNNVITFTDCREYQAESALRFGSAPSASVSKGGTNAQPHEPLPAGLALELRLIGEIDSDTAAAGDRVAATVVNAVHPPKSTEVLVPAGAVAHGRITRMEHRLLPFPYFLIAISFYSLEAGGESWPLSVKRDLDDELARARMGLALPGQPIRVTAPNAFVFPSSGKRYVLRSGSVSRWVTVASRN